MGSNTSICSLLCFTFTLWFCNDNNFPYLMLTHILYNKLNIYNFLWNFQCISSIHLWACDSNFRYISTKSPCLFYSTHESYRNHKLYLHITHFNVFLHPFSPILFCENTTTTIMMSCMAYQFHIIHYKSIDFIIIIFKKKRILDIMRLNVGRYFYPIWQKIPPPLSVIFIDP